MDRAVEPRPVIRPATAARRGRAWSVAVAAVTTLALSLSACNGGDRGEASESDPRQEQPAQSPALAEGDEGNAGNDGVGPSGGDPLDEGR